MASFHEKNGMWGMRARVRTESEFQYQTTPFLWNSKSEAEHDASLFIWYRSLKDSSDPLIPTPVGRWFKSMLPNSDWDSIRDHLVNRVEKKISGLKRKVGQIGVAINKKGKCSPIRYNIPYGPVTPYRGFRSRHPHVVLHDSL